MNMKYFEISSKWGKNVHLPFASLTYDILERFQVNESRIESNPTLIKPTKKAQKCQIM